MSTAQQTVDARSSYARIPAAFKLQFTVPSMLIWVPLLVFAAAWVIAVGIGVWIHAVAGGQTEPIYTGAANAPLWTLVAMAAYAASHTFPFSMALSYSRRVFVIGVFLAFGLVSLAFGAAFALGAGVERLTGGFGLEVYVFDLPYLTQGAGGVASAGALAAGLCLFLMMFGFFWAILYRRVSITMVWVVIIGLVIILLGAAMLVTQNSGWATVWRWFVEQSALSLAGWMVLPVIGITAVNYAVIRRATPG
ncbi:hypothetical protein [Nesterenkonia muleiensis]|uniref:hypothetical protein n=1 Tax=Nesterenkonia muleiensis TaxID=2282648 RepID=UPI000E744956|nr:hypothetical protein [Nesterenkonia muleiensis]